MSYWRSNLISCERVARDARKSQFYRSFWRLDFISCEKVARETRKSQFCRRCKDDEKMRRCEVEKMWRWEGVGWEGVKMRRGEDEMRRCYEKMWWQTSTIRRTLRSDALGKKQGSLQALACWSIQLFVHHLQDTTQNWEARRERTHGPTRRTA